MRIVGIGLTTAGEADRYMRKTMEEFKRLCDSVIICVNNGSQKEIDLIKEYGFNYYEDNREWGKEQPNLKSDLLARVEFEPDTWIVALDMDETFAPEFTKDVAISYASGQEIAYHFLIVNLYNDEQHFAHSSGIQRFWNIRFYKYLPELGLQFQRKALHCGLAPPYAYSLGWHAPFYLLHYGLMLPEDRQRKVERYRKYDPNKRYKAGTYYDELAMELPMRKFDPEGLLRKLKESPECLPRKIKPKLLLSVNS